MATILHIDQTTTEDAKLTFEEVQKTVGGYIEIVKIPGDRRVLAVNEDGRMKQLAVNENASALAGQTIVGTAVVTTLKELG